MGVGERGDPAPLPLAPACCLALLPAPGPGVCLPAALLSGPLVPTTLPFLLGALRTVLHLKAEDSEAGGVGGAAAPHCVRLREGPAVPQPSCADRTHPLLGTARGGRLRLQPLCGPSAWRWSSMWEAVPRPVVSTGSPGSSSLPAQKSCLLLLTSRIHLFLCDFFFFFWPYHAVCEISVPQPGMGPMSSASAVQSLQHWTTGKCRDFLDTVLAVRVWNTDRS